MIAMSASHRLRRSGTAGGRVDRDELVIGQTIAKRFETIVDRDPAAVAVRSGGVELSYRALNLKANALAQRLLGQSTNNDTPVVLLLNQGMANVIAVLGVLKAGRFFLPLDPEQPPRRNRRILEESGARILVTHSTRVEESALLAAAGQTVIEIDNLAGDDAAENPNVPVDPDSIAQIVYTSGSTGQPKGVIHSHRQVLHNVLRHTRAFHIDTTDRQTLLYPPHAYAGTREIYNSLLNGARLCHYPVAERGVAGLATWLQEEGISLYCSVTTVFRRLLDSLERPIELPRLRVIKLGGETTLKKDVERLWHLIHADCLVHCGLGISETGLASHYFLDRDSKIPGAKVPLGFPSLDMEILLLDDDRQPVAAGEVGEIAVRSRYISSGYWRQPDLTQTAFIPGSPDGCGPTYLTGDRGWIGPDGCLEHRGRKNSQVKVGGNRVDLSEIEQALASLEAIGEAAVLLEKDRQGRDRLTAYWTADQAAGKGTDRAVVADLRDALLQALPRYAIPSRFVELERMPLTPTGKIDKRALPAAEEAVRASDRSYVAPRSVTEEKVARLWAEVLGVDKIGVHDNFFDRGGDSLDAARLVTVLQTGLGLRIPAVALFQGSTVAQLAQMHDSGATALLQSATVAIRRQGSKRPFFAVGSHPRYAEIALRLGPDQPFYRLDVYALQSEQMKRGEKLHGHIEDIAARFVEDVRRLQPSGPYALGGGCEGSMVAFEIATQLQSQGQEVECILLWLARPPGYSAMVAGRTALSRVTGQARGVIGRIGWGDLRPRNLAQLVRHGYIEYRIFRAVDRYRPSRAFEGELTIARFHQDLPDNNRDSGQDPAGGWSAHATAGAAVRLVPGDHDTLLPLHAQELGDLVQSSLRIARREKQAWTA